MAETNSNASATTTPQTTQTEASLANTNLEASKNTTDSTQTNEGDKSLANTKAEPEVKGAPEKYEPFKAPEGFEFNEESLAKATPVFKELGLNQEGAQKLMDLYAAEVKAVAEGPVNHWLDMQKSWRDEITKDPTYGNGQGGLKPEVTKAIADVKSLLPPDVRTGFEEAMDLTGAGNNPFFIKALHFFAAKLTEGAHVAGNGPSAGGQQKPGAAKGVGPSALYPELKSGAAGG